MKRKRKRKSSPDCCSNSSSSSSSQSPHNIPGIISEKPKGKSKSNVNSIRRSSIYRGVTRHRWSGRFEAHLWDKSSWNNMQSKKGRQVSLFFSCKSIVIVYINKRGGNAGAYDSEEDAARTYDLAALKYWGPESILNFPMSRYEKEIEEMNKVSKEQYLASLRRQSNGFSRGVSKYRGVARHHHNGKWEARIGRVSGNKYLYLGTYGVEEAADIPRFFQDTQEEAAAAYDMAALEHRGANAVTNFDISCYIERSERKRILFLDQSLEQSPGLVDARPVKTERQPLQQQQGVEEAADISRLFQYMQMQLPLCVDDMTTVGMETTDDNELVWSFCMDSGLTSFSASDFPLEKTEELPNLFDGIAFKGNIDLMFDLGPKENAANREWLVE
ncbi:hypothetical protein GQ457_11G006850 [Hibiscus cannabinus]